MVVVVAQVRQADVIVVGAGPGGSASAYHLARHGLDVLLLEKSEFPREKVCGDGLTPRSVKQLIKMGVDTTPANGWQRNRGLRVIGGGVRLELDWPDLASFPNYGLTRSRLDLDQMLADHAKGAGAQLLTSHNVTGPVFDRDGRVAGVTASVGADKEPAEFHAPLYHFQLTFLAVSRSPMFLAVCAGKVVELAVLAYNASLPFTSAGALPLG